MKNYETQAVVCLDRSLYAAAQAHEAKPRVRGEAGNIGFKGGTVRRSALYCLGPQHILPEEYRISSARLIIVTHGVPSSTQISTGGTGRWSPEQLANAVKCWLGSCVIKRIALKICYAGGSRDGAVRRPGESLEAFAGRFAVDPRNSFAYKFARVCGFAQTITAQTGPSDTVIHGTTFRDFDEDKLTDVYEKVSGVKKGHAYKVILTPVRGATTSNPSEPSMSLVNPTR